MYLSTHTCIFAVRSLFCIVRISQMLLKDDIDTSNLLASNTIKRSGSSSPSRLETVQGRARIRWLEKVVDHSNVIQTYSSRNVLT